MKCRSRRLDKVGALIVDFYRGDIFDTARDELERDSAGASEEVEDGTLVVVDIIVKDVEKAFAGHVGSRSDR